MAVDTDKCTERTLGNCYSEGVVHFLPAALTWWIGAVDQFLVTPPLISWGRPFFFVLVYCFLSSASSTSGPCQWTMHWWIVGTACREQQTNGFPQQYGVCVSVPGGRLPTARSQLHQWAGTLSHEAGGRGGSVLGSEYRTPITDTRSVCFTYCFLSSLQ